MLTQYNKKKINRMKNVIYTSEQQTQTLDSILTKMLWCDEIIVVNQSFCKEEVCSHLSMIA